MWCLAVGIDGPLTVATKHGATRAAHSVLIPPRLSHQLTCHGAGLVSCYLEPTSDRADASRRKFGEWHGEVGVGWLGQEAIYDLPGQEPFAQRPGRYREG